MRSSGYKVEPPIRPQPTRMGMGPVPFTFLTSSAYSGFDHLPPPFKIYGKCTKNHGFNTSDGNVLDGCGEFISLTDPNDPSFLLCDACGCHRIFHREHMIMQPMQPVHNVVDYSCSSRRSRSVPSPMPVPSSYYSSLPFPHMFLASNPDGLPPQQHINNNNNPIGSGSNQNKGKNHRSKFSNVQKEEMFDLVGRIRWKIQKNNDEMVMGLIEPIQPDKN
ncbi:homeodomain-like protein [Tanacetum coccineum]